jgi:hypothetical protein
VDTKTKIPVITDVHLRKEKPTRRLDPDYLGTQLAELEYVYSYAQQNNAPCILCCGDLGDKHTWHPKAMTGLIELYNRYNIPIVMTLGQHDVKNHNTAGYRDESCIGALEEAGVLTVLRNGQVYELPGLTVFGFAYGEQPTYDFLSGKYVFPTGYEGLKVAIVHAKVGPYKAQGWDYIGDCNIRGVDIAFFGDIHPGFELHTFHGGAKAVSSGAMSRHTKDDIGRVPKFFGLSLDGEYETIEIPQLPDEELFDMVDIKEVIKAHRSEEFVRVYEQTERILDETAESLVARVNAANGYGEDIAKIVLDNIEV